MKVAILIFRLFTKGGGPRQALEEAIELQKLGHTVTVFVYYYNRATTYKNLCDQLTIKAVKTGYVLQGATDAGVVDNSRLKVLVIKQVKEEFFGRSRRFAALVQGDFDVINIHEWPANWVAPFLRRLRVPIVWMCNDVWQIPDPDGVGGGRVHRTIRAIRQKYLRPIKVLDRWATRSIDHITVLDHRIQSIVARYYRRPTSVVRSGVNSEHLQSLVRPTARNTILARHGLHGDAFVVLCASIYFSHRRFEDAVEAVAMLRERYPMLRLLIVGSTLLEPNYGTLITAHIQRSGVTKEVIQVNTFLSDEELYLYYQACDAFIFPNNHQTWGLAPIEAMVLGKPVIISRGSGVHEVISDGQTGLLVPAESPSVIAEKIEYLMTNPQERIALAERGRRFAVETFSWKKYAQQMAAVFHHVQNV